MNLILMRAGYPPTLIKIDDRQEYFNSLDYDTSFLTFIIQATYETVEQYVQNMLTSSALHGHASLKPKNKKIISSSESKVIEIGEDCPDGLDLGKQLQLEIQPSTEQYVSVEHKNLIEISDSVFDRTDEL